MKVFRTILAIAITILLVSCGEEKKEITVTGADGKVYKSYQAACRNNDYEAAHEFLDILKQEAEAPANSSIFDSGLAEKNARKKAFEDALDYVYTQEIMYLVSEGSDVATNRVLFLLTELQSELSQTDNKYEKEKHERFFNNQCDKTVELAASQGNIELVKKVLSMYSSSEAQTKKCIQMLPKGDEFIDLAINSLTNYDIRGLSVSEGLHEYYYAYDLSGDNKQRNLYIKELSSINTLCNQLLDFAINHGEKKLAKKILQLYKQNVVVTSGSHDGVKVNGVKVDGNHCYVQFTWQDKDLAKKRYKEAVANGTFKK